MSKLNQTRRDFLKTSAGVAAAASVPYLFTSSSLKAAESKNDRLILGCIGTGSRWGAVGPNAMQLSDCVAIADVDRSHADKAAVRVKQIQGKEPEVHEDYRKILDRKDIDVVTIVTPDHWHTKIAIEAMQAGKDVYCEKPLTLTIEEGKQLLKVLKETGRVFQVGTQQRSEMNLQFLKAVAMIFDGRIGDVEKVHVAIGGAPTSGPIPKVDVPSHLNWDMWLGQAPLVDYRYKPGGRWGNSRCHYEFRWWYEYSGGKMTDWGAHHMDIAQWAIGADQPGRGPVSLEGTATHPVPFKDGYPTLDDQYNAATNFRVKIKYPSGVDLELREACKDLGFDNGILFEGTKGRLFVNRGKLTGQAVDELKDNPLPEDALVKAYKGKTPGGGNAHMRNFFECIKTREQPISDVDSHHRAMTTCHLANIAIRLDRPIKWNPITQQIMGDDEAKAFQSREQRKGYEIVT